MPDIFLDVAFVDRLQYDDKTKTVVSIRDGVQEYQGWEIGLEPPDKIFKIYRAPETIRSISGSLVNLPVTDDHVDLDSEPDRVIGTIINSQVVDFLDKSTGTTVYIKNRVLFDQLPKSIELSLGYRAALIPCSEYDYEQVEFIPHHLAVVSKGRCGEICKFLDKKEKKKMRKINSAFLDAEGDVNIQQILQLVVDLPEAIKSMPINDLAKLIPVLQKAVSFASETVAAGGGEDVEEDVEEGTEQEKTTDEAEMKKEDEEEKEKKFSDSVTAEVKKQNRIYADVMIKAKDFLPETFNFSDKSAHDIMRAALATQSKDKFLDSELPIAFKMLRKTTDYSKFGDKDGARLELSALADKEI